MKKINIKIKRLGTGSNNTALLAGILKCSICGSNMIVKQGHKSKTDENKRYDYYVCSSKDNSRCKKCTNKNIRVDRLDKIVSEQLIAYDTEFLREQLHKLIDTSTSLEKNNNTSNKITVIKSEIDSKEIAISNLVKQLSAAVNENVVNYIMQEINKLSDEVNDLKLNLDNTVNNKKTFDFDIDNLNIIIESLDRFSSTYNSLSDISQKRLLIQTILSKVIWDGENYNARLVILEDKKK